MNIDSIMEVLLPAIATGGVGWLFGKRRSNAETRGVEITNAERLAEVWQKNAESMEKQIADLLAVTEALRKENLSLKETVYGLQKEVAELKAQNNKLINKLNEIKKYAQNNNSNNSIPGVDSGTV
ncbi:hypothetical protein [Pinibacter soli]|uniref:Cell wall anchor protein n=1 Tax=Pinibacter soli TaxID=3044211 RepID=A0ABT6R978_9BACT|nr:hypothetical protein [Pinibacter soli]MDI3319121.1 hypothetical protein [Pinibacter soli]